VIGVTVTVREYARLTTGICSNTLDTHHISPAAFDWLCTLQSRLRPGGASLLEVEGRQWLRLDSLVGVIQTPCGTTLEILPKTHSHEDGVASSRAMLRKMIMALLDLPAKEAGEAVLERFDVPLSEWVMRQYLLALQRLVQRGLRQDYVRVEEELPYLRGQLDTTAQMRQTPGRAHHFHVRHDVFMPDRAENRLLKLALERVRRATGQADNWRLAQELSIRLHEVPASKQPQQDWREWSRTRLMSHYQPIRPWCQLVLGQGMPIALAGDNQGLSLMFPMEKLFEAYVARWLRKSIPQHLCLTAQAASEYLCWHEGRRMFQMRPDLLLRAPNGRAVMVMDTKWKRLEVANQPGNYGLAQGDFYQMLAYGQSYLGGRGKLALIYPAWEGFDRPLPTFEMGDGLEVEVLRFDLESDRLCVPDGFWHHATVQSLTPCHRCIST
jgi:5-methylcytosine-specific restriction enzyme subunit McrC